MRRNSITPGKLPQVAETLVAEMDTTGKKTDILFTEAISDETLMAVITSDEKCETVLIDSDLISRPPHTRTLPINGVSSETTGGNGQIELLPPVCVAVDDDTDTAVHAVLNEKEAEKEKEEGK